MMMHPTLYPPLAFDAVVSGFLSLWTTFFLTDEISVFCDEQHTSHH
jgi:hypothetical protein